MARTRKFGLASRLFAALLFGVGCSSPDVGNPDDLHPPTDSTNKADAATGTPSTPGSSEPPPGNDPDGGTTPPPDPDAGTPPPSPQPLVVKKIKDLTGTKTSSGTFGVGGTDLGVPIRQPNGKIAFIFGDTFDKDGTGGSGWRAPVLLRSEPGNLDQGITFTSAAGGNYAKQILNYSHANKETWLPSDALTIGNTMYLQVMKNKPFGTVYQMQIASSTDNGETWNPVGTASWDGNYLNGMFQLWTWDRGDDGYIYVMSSKFDRKHGLILHRVQESKFLDHTAYEPWGFKNGQWGWGNPPTPILDGSFGEMCLRKLGNKWVLAWFNAGNYNITVKVFDTPTSNLFQAKTFTPISGGAWGLEDDTHVAQLYGGYIHPESTLDNVTLIVSQWNTKTNWPYHAMQFNIRGLDQ